MKLPSLFISSGKVSLGADVAIIGFPTFDSLQRVENTPYVKKSIISSALRYPFNTDAEEFISERIAIDGDLGDGFSGSPVISIKDFKVVGIIDYSPVEMSEGTAKMDKTSKTPPLEGIAAVAYPCGITLAIPAVRINQYLDLVENMDRSRVVEMNI